ncbi:MAG: hypothetical protein IK099_07120, partial [Clostridia bacterium]|nr:hypothetical protein [Clostridia bacterium]
SAFFASSFAAWIPQTPFLLDCQLSFFLPAFLCCYWRCRTFTYGKDENIIYKKTDGRIDFRIKALRADGRHAIIPLKWDDVFMKNAA